MSQSCKSDEIYDAIVRKVFSSRKVQAGQRLVERELAAELNVSRVPIREALARLVFEGLLVGGDKGQGVFVRQYSAEDVRHLYEFRQILEDMAVRAAAKRANESDLLRLEMICDEMEKEVERFESPRWLSLDQKFHNVLAAASHNQRIADALRLMLVECFFMFYAPSHAQVDTKEKRVVIAQRLVFEHRSIIEAIRLQDASKAAAASKEHLDWAGDLAWRLCIANELNV